MPLGGEGSCMGKMAQHLNGGNREEEKVPGGRETQFRKETKELVQEETFYVGNEGKDSSPDLGLDKVILRVEEPGRVENKLGKGNAVGG